jgi:hypothetical protein
MQPLAKAESVRAIDEHKWPELILSILLGLCDEIEVNLLGGVLLHGLWAAADGAAGLGDGSLGADAGGLPSQAGLPGCHQIQRARLFSIIRFFSSTGPSSFSHCS